LTHDNIQKEIEADYNKSVEEVFRDAMIFILQVEESTAIYGFFPLRRGTRSTLPSWVPNFAASQQDSQDMPKNHIISEAAPSHNAEDVKLSDCKNKLIVKAQLLDVVQTVITIPAKGQPVSIWAYPQIIITTLVRYTSIKLAAVTRYMSIPGMVGSVSLLSSANLCIQMSQDRTHGIKFGQTLIDIERLVTRCVERLGNSSLVEPLWKLLLISSPPPDNLGSDEECQTKFDNIMAAVRELVATGRLYKWWIVHDSTTFFNRMGATAPLSGYIMGNSIGESRKFFACDGGCYGIGEGDVRERDQLAFLFPGTNVPFILRKNGDCFEMVGPARVPAGMQSVAATSRASQFQEITII
jgi:hypothetical protein